MGLGSNSSSSKIYLSVGFGKIRQKSLENKEKVNAQTPGAVKRLKQDKTETWAIEHDFVSGIIESLFYKEDQQYGNSFEVVIVDGLDKFQLSFSEDSRFWFDFMKKLPNVELKSVVKITAYDFTDKQNKRRAGISLEQNGNKILSFYEKKKEDQSWELLHGFPKADVDINWKDKDDVKAYSIKIKKFLRNEFMNKIQPLFEHSISVAEETNLDGMEPDPTDDLPF